MINCFCVCLRQYANTKKFLMNIHVKILDVCQYKQICALDLKVTTTTYSIPSVSYENNVNQITKEKERITHCSQLNNFCSFIRLFISFTLSIICVFSSYSNTIFTGPLYKYYLFNLFTAFVSLSYLFVLLLVIC